MSINKFRQGIPTERIKFLCELAYLEVLKAGYMILNPKTFKQRNEK